MISAMVFWGLSWTNAKILGQYTGPSVVMFWRFLFATISLGIGLKYFDKSFNFKLDSIRFVISNSLFLVFYNYFYFKGTQIGSAGSGGVLVTTLNPTLTTLLSFMLGDKILKKDYLGLCLGLISGGLILRIWSIDFESIYQSGNLFYILASLSWASVTIITFKSKNYITYLSYSFWSFAFATILCLPLNLDTNLFSIFKYDLIFWINLLLLSLFAMSFGTSIFFLASTELGPKKASSYILMVPFIAMGFAMVFLGEPLQLTTLIGGVIGVISIYVINS